MEPKRGLTDADHAWRAYAAAAINGAATAVLIAEAGADDDVRQLCDAAAMIADEMVRREAERADEP